MSKHIYLRYLSGLFCVFVFRLMETIFSPFLCVALSLSAEKEESDRAQKLHNLHFTLFIHSFCCCRCLYLSVCLYMWTLYLSCDKRVQPQGHNQRILFVRTHTTHI